MNRSTAASPWSNSGSSRTAWPKSSSAPPAGSGSGRRPSPISRDQKDRGRSPGADVTIRAKLERGEFGDVSASQLAEQTYAYARDFGGFCLADRNGSHQAATFTTCRSRPRAKPGSTPTERWWWRHAAPISGKAWRVLWKRPPRFWARAVIQRLRIPAREPSDPPVFALRASAIVAAPRA